jgi:hypothetical protein
MYITKPYFKGEGELGGVGIGSVIAGMLRMSVE